MAQVVARPTGRRSGTLPCRGTGGTMTWWRDEGWISAPSRAPTGRGTGRVSMEEDRGRPQRVTGLGEIQRNCRRDVRKVGTIPLNIYLSLLLQGVDGSN